MNSQIVSLLGKPWVIPTSVGIVAFSGGGVLGYILGRNRKQKAIGELVLIKNEQLEEYADTVEELEKRTEQLVELTEDLKDMTIVELRAPEGDPVESDVNLIVEPDDDWDFEVELSTRKPDQPYILHRDEFFADEMGYTQSTVTYYQGDDILTDELDVPIYGHTAMVGELKFGHGSGDPNVVYIRSELLEHEYEVLLSFGRYEVEVLGHEIDEHYKDDDLRHSIVRKFKMD